MTQASEAKQILGAVRSRWEEMAAVLPGLFLTMLNATMLDLPRADVIDALDSDRYRIQWIHGSYIVGAAAGMAITSFLASRFGLRRAYLAAILIFTVAGTLCGTVSEVIWMAPLRFLQGFGMGLTICSGMVLIWRAYPTRKELAMGLYGLGVYLPALAGAPVGGLLTALLSWRLIFLVNLPLGVLVGAAAWWTLPRDEPQQPSAVKFDLFGYLLLLTWIATINVVLDMGQYWGWLNSPDFVPWFVAFVISFATFIAWGILALHPTINLRPLAIRNFGLGILIKALYSINLLVLVKLLSGYMIDLRQYQWWQGALVILPAVGTMFLAVIASAHWGTPATRRLRMFVGLGIMAVATWQLSVIDVYTAKELQSALLGLWAIGAGLVVVPALLTVFEGLTNEQTLKTAGVFNIFRSMPAFLVGAILATLLTQRTDAQFDVLRQNIRYNRPIVSEAARQPERHFAAHGSGHAVVGKQAHATLHKWVHANSRAFAFQSVLQMLALVPASAMVLVLLLRKPAPVEASA
ncbi:MAG: MFS transporter [Gemmataceae bacterium]|nr:MFS transporter [Gemmataceae bacterium]